MSASDSSEEEDLSRFKDVVDTSFTNDINLSYNRSEIRNNAPEIKKKSERYLAESTHYNDVKVPKELQLKIGKKISSIINQCVEFVDIEPKKIKRKIKGGVRLFRDSDDYLSCHEAEDRFTENHNVKAKKLKQIKECVEIDEVIKSVAVSGEYVLSKEEIKCWKSRRKEKVFKYKSNGKGVLISTE
ncbi:uncharacterized protein LOC111002078 isoform X2 [Pieris rapae]|uniref:uncharacterized protein LOC111002078 isoform X2 n=1 Tax=Pieris rapae TaxID=64459 RepID=UPI001E27B2FA|nr:uncharacterized protein LOC111002078 isoform X2 [Pieris rapae]